MKLFRKLIFKLGYLLIRPQVIKSLSILENNKDLSLNQLKVAQDEAVKKIIEYSYDNVPYYNKLFVRLGLNPSDIRTVTDLEKLPVLTKEIIRENIDDFTPQHINTGEIVLGSTGGSTGAPLKYKMSDECYSMGVACLYRGWALANYELGDKVAVIAGGSLVNKKPSLMLKFRDFVLNFRHYTTYGMDETLIKEYMENIEKWNPDILRGYATSIYEIAKYLDRNKIVLKLKLKAIITTAEMLLPQQRAVIERVFDVKVYDTYGLNDGGISAYECSAHNGMHIDMERAVMECVDQTGKQVVNGEGLLLATSLLNEAMPFIRYDTGDLGYISDVQCQCGCELPIIKHLKGRVTDSLKLNGKVIGSPVLTVLMGQIDILQYQIIQYDEQKIEIRINKGDRYSDEDQQFIAKSLQSQVGELSITFNYEHIFESNDGSKHKFIINKMNY